MKTNRYEFESKFSNGQRVWFVNNGKVYTGPVTEIIFTSKSDGVSEIYWRVACDSPDRWPFMVTNAFATEAEAIQERDRLNEEHKKTVL